MVRLHARMLLVVLLLTLGVSLPGCTSERHEPLAPIEHVVSLEEIPEFSGQPFVEVDGNEPAFTDAERGLSSFEAYEPLDELVRADRP